MKKIFLVITGLFFGLNSFSQSKIIYEEFQSVTLKSLKKELQCLPFQINSILLIHTPTDIDTE